MVRSSSERPRGVDSSIEVNVAAKVLCERMPGADHLCRASPRSHLALGQRRGQSLRDVVLCDIPRTQCSVTSCSAAACSAAATPAGSARCGSSRRRAPGIDFRSLWAVVECDGVKAVRRALHAAVSDITPLRESVPFQRLFTGQAVSLVGTQVAQVAVPLQVYAITGSSLEVGLIGFAGFVPLIVFDSKVARSPTRSTVASCCWSPRPRQCWSVSSC